MSIFAKELRISWLSPLLARTPPTTYLLPVLRRLPSPPPPRPGSKPHHTFLRPGRGALALVHDHRHGSFLAPRVSHPYYTFLRSGCGALPSVSDQREGGIDGLRLLWSHFVQKREVPVRHDLRLWPLDLLKDESKVTVFICVEIKHSTK